MRMRMRERERERGAASMDKAQEHCRPPQHSSRHGSGKIISCALAAGFIIVFVVALAVASFFLLRPRDPEIRVVSVHLPRFSSINSTVRMNFAQYAAVRNPNRATFSHYDSWIQILYVGHQVGFMYIPAGEIAGGRTVYMSASFSVDSFPLAAAQVGIFEVESRMRVKGRVRVLMYFTHHIEAAAGC
ncbi:hypothetical protein AXF42_Ash000246 [Apostasia shenzhenica]|uniref:Late embryogenesis abundant protein LEA-2 subgroup domain-containing protein n=1 Tax=Apostasia shenzhenica TaxID=1088818 RepID=A0A2I0AFU2_9ASPA|nr:hypothetical protein AXF42_Ash000246 [Apostasia shenzhenica]